MLKGKRKNLVVQEMERAIASGIPLGEIPAGTETFLTNEDADEPSGATISWDISTPEKT